MKPTQDQIEWHRETLAVLVGAGNSVQAADGTASGKHDAMGRVDCGPRRGVGGNTMTIDRMIVYALTDDIPVEQFGQVGSEIFFRTKNKLWVHRLADDTRWVEEGDLAPAWVVYKCYKTRKPKYKEF